MSYAEDEGDVDGTVNGVTATATGTLTSGRAQTSCLCRVFVFVAVRFMRVPGAVLVSGQVGAAVLCWFVVYQCSYNAYRSYRLEE